MLQLFIYSLIGVILQLFFYWGITLLAVMMFVENRKSKRLRKFMEKALPEYLFCNFAVTCALICINDFRVVLCAAILMSRLYSILLRYNYKRFKISKPKNEISQNVEFAK